MKKANLISLTIMFLITGCTAVFVSAQSDPLRLPATVERVKSPPVLTQSGQSQTNDERATSDGKDTFWLRSGKNISLPLTPGATLQTVLTTPLSTKGMRADVEMYRQLLVKTSVITEYGSQLIPKEAMIETRITGHSAKMIDSAALLIEPQRVFVEIAGYLPVGIAPDGETIYLKPGKWELTVHATFRSLQSPDGQVSMYSKSDSESIIKGKKFGKEPRLNQSSGEYFDGLLYLNPYGSIAYGLTKVGKLLGFILRRPNIVLPQLTEVFFQIERIDATYLMPAVPKLAPRLLR
jgi:hypothetical protein